jgi:hypothetical protein
MKNCLDCKNYNKCYYKLSKDSLKCYWLEITTNDVELFIEGLNKRDLCVNNEKIYYEKKDNL